MASGKVSVWMYRGGSMEMNTKDTGLEVIPVQRNPYPSNYGNNGNYEKKQRVNPNRARYQVRGQQLKRQPGRNSGQRASVNRRRARAARRRQRLQIQCAAVAFGIIALTIIGVSVLVKNHRAAAAASGSSQKATVGNGAGTGAGNIAGSGNGSGMGNAAGSDGVTQSGAGQPSGVTVQGIPAEIFARHPEWEENFLTPNEYSRPGDELPEVKNIFVHYTANPGTSAAQNRSYFERQKDEHRASVSSHFIIGYDGEIIQCVPLTEIAYAVQTRNFDSVSIECCYKAKDGSFTKETYNSLISLLAWLTDVYDLDTEDILRHYDCGGKKCPLYYTDHADKWKQLKEDVKQMKENAGVKL